MSEGLRTPVDDVPAVAAFLGIAERTLRRSLEEGGELARYRFPVGQRRVLVKTAALLADLGVSPDGNAPAATADAIALADRSAPLAGES